MNEIYQLVEKAGLAIAVILLINLQVLPELRAIRKELMALALLITKTTGADLRDVSDLLTEHHKDRKRHPEE